MSGTINKTDYVILQKIGGEHMRVMKLSSKQKVLIEKLKFNADSVFGKPFGLFEVVGDNASPTNVENLMKFDNTKDIEMPGETAITESADTNKNEVENGVEGQLGQKLSQDDVLSMKSQGLSAGELVAKLVEGNKGFENRTEYSKSKYIRRKTKKHSDRVLILKPTIRLLCQSYYNKDAERLSNLRVDQLGLLIQMGNVHFQSNVLVFEQSLGLITAAVLERLGGHGTCVHLHRGAIAQSIPCVHAMNFSEEVLSTFCPVRITTLVHGKPDSQAPDEPIEEMNENVEEKGEKTKSEESKIDRAARENRGLAQIQEGMDSIIIVSRCVDVLSILASTFNHLKPSGTVAIYSPHLSPLMEAQAWLMENHCVNAHLSNQMYRVQQVLPDRTHPLMSQNVVGGYVLSAIKVSS